MKSTSKPTALVSFSDTVATALAVRADELGARWTRSTPDLIRAFAATLADAPPVGDAATAFGRELTRVVRLRRAQGHPLSTVLGELERLQDVMFDELLAQAKSAGEGVPAEAVLELAKRFHHSGRAMDRAARDLYQKDSLARRRSHAALLGGFARAVTHELRNRVNAARLSFSVYRLSPEDRRDEMLDILDQSIKQLEESVGDVSSMLVAQARDRPLEGPFQPVGDLLAQLAGELRDLTMAGRVELRIASPLPDVAVDGGKLRLALLNLVSNATKHVDRSKGERWIEIRMGAGGGRGEWRVDVVDNGTGLPLVERFSERAVGETATEAAPPAIRHGIGITLATRAVEELGGRLWIEANDPGQGTTVSFTLRARPPRAGAGSSGEAAAR
jgi:signal transduction histidine kinase